MTKKKAEKIGKLTIPENIDFHYLKTSNYRTFHVDGIFGGPTPNGNIYMELFVERAPTPKQVTHQVNKDGTLGVETKRDGKLGLIREIEAGIIFDLVTAEKIQKWLSGKIEVLKKAREGK